jgi:hypothetical protein
MRLDCIVRINIRRINGNKKYRKRSKKMKPIGPIIGRLVFEIFLNMVNRYKRQHKRLIEIKILMNMI